MTCSNSQNQNSLKVDFYLGVSFRLKKNESLKAKDCRYIADTRNARFGSR